MKTNQNFFFLISELEQKILLSDLSEKNYKEETRISLKKLIQLIESSPIHNTKFYKFVCSNFRLKINEMYVLYLQSKIGTLKENSFRTSYYAINKEFLDLFESVTDIEIAYLNNDLDKIKEINFIILSVSLDKKFCMNYLQRLGINLNQYMKEVKKKPKNQYTLEECALEIEFLKAIDKETIQTTLDTLDQDKIRYLITLLSKSIIGSSARINTEKNKTTYSHSKTINTEKLELLKQLNVVQPMSFVHAEKFNSDTPSDISSTEINQALDDIEVKATEVKQEVGKTTKYTEFFTDNELVNKILTLRTNRHIDELDDIQADWNEIQARRNESNENMQVYRKILFLMNAFTFFDLDYFEYSLNQIPLSYIQIALKNYNKGRKNGEE